MERRRIKSDIPALLKILLPAMEKISAFIDEMHLSSAEKGPTYFVRSGEYVKNSLTALAQRLLASEEAHYDRATMLTDLTVKLGPVFGLLGTLIPLGPGIVALGQGDTETLSASLGVAFDTTIAGLISAAICYIISGIRKRWYEDYLTTTETIMISIIEEVTPID